MIRHSLKLVLALLCISAAAQVPTTHLLDQLSVPIYRDLLDNRLFTRMGHNRGYGPHHDPCRDFIEARYRSYGLNVRLHPFLLAGNTYYNVVAVLPGEVFPDQQYIMIAHFDTVNNPGADDNGTGTAALLEVARIVADYRFERTIIFIASDREEDGMKGSAAYANEYRNDDIRGVINIDMIGYRPSGNAAHIYGRPASDPFKFALRDAILRYTDLSVAVGGELNRSDHAPFEAVGKQAAFLIERWWEQNPHYHQQTDSTDTQNYIDYEYAVKMTRGAMGLLVDRAGLLPTFLPSGFVIAKGAPGFGTITELFNSDDLSLEVRAIRPFEIAAPSAAIETWTEAASQNAAEIILALESRSTGLPCRQTVELYDNTAQRWVMLDTRFVGDHDVKLMFEVGTDPSRFIHPATRHIRARISAHDWGVPLVGWSFHIDRVNWVVR